MYREMKKEEPMKSHLKKRLEKAESERRWRKLQRKTTRNY